MSIFPASAAPTWQPKGCRVCFHSETLRLSASRPSRRVCRKSCGAFAKRPMRLYLQSPMHLSSSIAPNSRTAWQSACGRDCRKFRLSTMSVPSVWAWRPGRARAMRAYVDHVLALLPFEPKVMAELGGPPCTYVGHPLVERLDDLRPKDLEKRLRLANPPLILVLPGSREGEIRRMTSVFGQAIARVIEQFGPAEVVVPAVSRLADTVRAAVASWSVPARVVTDAEEKAEAFRSARAALSKSGTSTLELALAGVPMVAAYKVSLIEEVAGRLLAQWSVGNPCQPGARRKRRAGIPPA